MPAVFSKAVFSLSLVATATGLRIVKEDPLSVERSEPLPFDGLAKAICRSSVRRDQGDQCMENLASAESFHHEHESTATYHRCTDDWDSKAMGMGTRCMQDFPGGFASPCAKACLFEALHTLAAKHGSIAQMLKWGVTDLTLWHQFNSLQNPRGDGFRMGEFVKTFAQCADGGDRAFVPRTLIQQVYECLDADQNKNLDGAELTQPMGCVKNCLNHKNPTLKLDHLADDDDVSDLFAQITGSGALKSVLGGSTNCITGAEPCGECPVFHVDYDPEVSFDAPVEHSDSIALDLYHQCHEWTEKCQGDGAGTPLCEDDEHHAYCQGVTFDDAEHMDFQDNDTDVVAECLHFYDKCCVNAEQGVPMNLDQCKPCDNEFQCGADWFAVQSGFCKKAGTADVDKHHLAFCAGIFQTASGKAQNPISVTGAAAKVALAQKKRPIVMNSSKRTTGAKMPRFIRRLKQVVRQRAAISRPAQAFRMVTVPKHNPRTSVRPGFLQRSSVPSFKKLQKAMKTPPTEFAPINGGTHAAAPPAVGGDYDHTVAKDVLHLPECPVEKFTDPAGVPQVIRNEEYYNMYCHWMHQVLEPSADYDLGHFVDSSTKAFAGAQYVADGTCMPEIKVAPEAPVKDEDIHDVNAETCRTNFRTCTESGDQAACDFVGHHCEGVEFRVPVGHVGEIPTSHLPDVHPGSAPTEAPAPEPVPVAPVLTPPPQPPAGAIPAATGEAGEAIPLGTGGDLSAAPVNAAAAPAPAPVAPVAPPPAAPAAMAPVAPPAPVAPVAPAAPVTPAAVAAPILPAPAM